MKPLSALSASNYDRLQQLYLTKEAGKLTDLVNRASHFVQNQPVAQVAQSVAHMSPGGQQAMGLLDRGMQGLRGMAEKAEAHPAYQAARSVRDVAHDVANLPAVQQHVVQPLQQAAAPYVQAAGQAAAPLLNRAQQAAAPVVNAAQGALGAANQTAETMRAPVTVAAALKGTPLPGAAPAPTTTPAAAAPAPAAAPGAPAAPAQGGAQSPGMLDRVRDYFNSVVQKYKINDPATLSQLWQSVSQRLQNAYGALFNKQGEYLPLQPARVTRARENTMNMYTKIAAARAIRQQGIGQHLAKLAAEPSMDHLRQVFGDTAMRSVSPSMDHLRQVFGDTALRGETTPSSEHLRKVFGDTALRGDVSIPPTLIHSAPIPPTIVHPAATPSASSPSRARRRTDAADVAVKALIGTGALGALVGTVGGGRELVKRHQNRKAEAAAAAARAAEEAAAAQRSMARSKLHGRLALGGGLTVGGLLAAKALSSMGQRSDDERR